MNMYDILLALLLVSLNIGSFLLLDVSKRFNVNKNKLSVGFVVLLCGVVSFLLVDSRERVVMSFYISVCLFGCLGLKFLMFKLFPPKETQSRGVRIVRKIIDSYFMPIFVLQMSVLQCMYLLLWG